MKPVDFALLRASSLPEAVAALQAADARPIAGGQSLTPMLNLRLARPGTLVSVAAVPELRSITDDARAITLGAAITHAEVEDGRTPDLPGRVLARVAETIAYRAVRTRGTIGGSLCHADPAADWPCVLTALGAQVIVAGPRGRRAVPLPGFIAGAFRVDLQPGEIAEAVRIPRPSARARWGYYKACRKPGEFAHAMAAVLIDGTTRRGVVGATGGPPVVLPELTPAAVEAALADGGLDPIARHMHAVAFRRACDRAGA